MPLARLTSKGQVVIPKSVRDRLKLRTGDHLDFALQEDGSILVRPITEDVRSLSGALARPGRRTASLQEMQPAVQKRGR